MNCISIRAESSWQNQCSLLWNFNDDIWGCRKRMIHFNLTIKQRIYFLFLGASDFFGLEKSVGFGGRGIFLDLDFIIGGEGCLELDLGPVLYFSLWAAICSLSVKRRLTRWETRLNPSDSSPLTYLTTSLSSRSRWISSSTSESERWRTSIFCSNFSIVRACESKFCFSYSHLEYICSWASL